MILEGFLGGLIGLMIIFWYFKTKPELSGQVCAVLGSGGHTNEMMRMIDGLANELKPTIYICSSSDTLSQTRITQTSSKSKLQVVLLPRPRNVGQSYLTSIFTTLRTIWVSCLMLRQCCPSLILCNGPGISVCVAISCYLLSAIFGINRPKLVYVESFARTKKLSLTGYVMQFLADKYFVQWMALERPKGHLRCARNYIGLLV